MFKRISGPLAVLAIGALAACGGGGSTTTTPNTNPTSAPVTGVPLAGVGDSLTAGYQSGGLLGQYNPLVTSPLSAYPGGAVPPTQENGFWALFYQQMTGTSAASPNGPLPLIAGPGLGAQIVLSTVAPPFAPTHSGCDAFNDQAYSSSGWQSTRLNANASILDVAVPGITMHEAVTMKAPLTGPGSGPSCGYPTVPGDPTSGALQSLVAGESLMFYPVLGGFQSSLGNNLTELNAAASLKPGLTTVWLGANDLLKYAFSNARSPVTDTPTQLAADLTQIVSTLKAGGSKVIVANLPDILSTPQFFPQPKLSADLQALGVPAPVAAGTVAYLGQKYGVGPGGYLTESGFLTVVAYLQKGATPVLDPAGPGSGQGGYYLPDAYAAQIAALNAGYNQAIGAVVQGSGSGVALADVEGAFKALAAGGGYTVAPGETMTLQFGGGLLGWDGLHPSNTGYAVIANVFIQAADTQLGLNVAPLSGQQIATIANGDGTPVHQPDPYNPYAIKQANPMSPFPLP